MELIVSLPDNRADLAEAAQAGGADAVKLHLNVTHRASGTSFGGFLKERERIADVLDAVSITVGLMPGSDRLPDRAELTELSEMGISFIDVYAHNMPAWLVDFPEFNKIPALDFQSSENAAYQISLLHRKGAAEIAMVELSVVHPQEYGKPLTLSDLGRYSSFLDACALPALIPTQKRIEPEDLERLDRLGCAGIMIGSVVTGDSPEELEARTSEYRAAIRELE